MEFWGVEVKAGEPLKVKSDDDKLVHLSVACLGELKKGKEDDSVSLFVSVNDQKIVIGILSPKKSPQISFDLVFDTDFELSHNWKNGSIYFTGYKFSDSELENDPIVPKENGKFEVKKEQSSIPAVKTTAAKTESSSPKPITKSVESKKEDNPEDDSDSDEEDSDSDEEGTAAMLGSSSTKSGTKIVDAKKDDKPLDDSASDEEDTDSDEEDSDSDEEGSDSDEEGIVAKLGSSTTMPGTKPMQPKKEGKPLDDSDSDSDEEDSEDDDIEFNGDESSSEDFDDDDLDDSDDELTTKKEISSRKRPAESAPMIPVQEKKAKLITPQKIGSDSKKDGVHVATPYPSKQAGRGTGASNKSKQLKPKQRSGK